MRGSHHWLSIAQQALQDVFLDCSSLCGTCHACIVFLFNFEEHRDVGSRVLLDDCDCGHLKGTVVEGCMRGPSELAT